MTDIKEQAYGKPPIGFDTGSVVYPSVSSCMTVSVISANGIAGAHFGIMDGQNKVALDDLTSWTKQTLQLAETKGGPVNVFLSFRSATLGRVTSLFRSRSYCMSTQ